MSKRKIPDISGFLKDATLMDDFFMTVFFQDRPECVKELLNAFLPFEVTITAMSTQYTIDNVNGRDVTLDIYAKDPDKDYDIEIQRRSDGAKPQRARFHSSMLDTKALGQKQKFTEINDSYVIFITEYDIFKLNKPIYHIERTIFEADKQFNDGSHIIYVNGAYKGTGNSKLEDIIHDFKCKDAAKMRNKILRSRFEELKVNPTEKEIDDMSDSIDLRFKALINEVRDEVLDEVRHQVRNEVRDEILDEVRHQVRDEVRNEVRDEVRDEVRHQVRDEVRDEVRNEVRDEILDEAYSKNSKEIAKSMLVSGIIPDEKIAEWCRLSVEQIRELRDSA